MQRTYSITNRKKISFCLVTLFLLSLVFAGSSPAALRGHDLWGELLAEFVGHGTVDYKGLKLKEGKLDVYLTFLDRTNPELLTRNEQIAFYINAYNAYTVKLILENFDGGQPVESIKKIGGFFSGPWDIKFCRIGGKVYSLDNIEHDILRPRYKEPRVHFAVNCASRSCPPLRPIPYKGDSLEEQLTHGTTAFLNDPKRNYYQDGTLYVSKIFKWFGEDFDDEIISFFLQYSQGKLKKELVEQNGKIVFEYLDYDWSLNDR